MQRAAPWIPRGAIIVSTVKGIELGSWMRIDQVLEQVLDAEHHPRLTFLSGPSFAREIADGRPTAVTIACRKRRLPFPFRSRSRRRGFAATRAAMSSESRSAERSRTSSRSRWGSATASSWG
jgi:glycerol-3-phosphate dehydrogenase